MFLRLCKVLIFTSLYKSYKIRDRESILNIFKTLIIYLIISVTALFSQDLVEDLSTTGTVGDEAEIFTERIINIGRSQKIFILTNTNSLLNKGDFITLIVDDNKAAARALVAKNYNSLAGIKILKIYSLSAWSNIHKDMDIKILKGDDSILFTKKDEKKKDEDNVGKVEGEEDLYAEELALESSFEGDFSKDNRLIKPDNIISASFGRFLWSDSKTNGDKVGGFELTGGWAYQFRDNFWAEGLVTYLSVNDYPDVNDNTVFTRLTFRLKYTVKLPFYSYLMPYLGYQVNLVSSPNATTAQEDANIQDLAQDQIAIGATLLRRLVPGWFLKVDLGTDLINIGAAVEF